MRDAQHLALGGDLFIFSPTAFAVCAHVASTSSKNQHGI